METMGNTGEIGRFQDCVSIVGIESFFGFSEKATAHLQYLLNVRLRNSDLKNEGYLVNSLDMKRTSMTINDPTTVKVLPIEDAESNLLTVRRLYI
jgi:hypothetical protein